MIQKKYFAISSVLALIVIPQITRAQTAISTCQTISMSGSYMLTTNLSATGDCLVVTANDVTIDLAGFAITGSGTGNGIVDDGDAGNGLQIGIRVRNGTIQNFANGIFLAFSIRAVVEKVHVSSNSGYGFLTGSQAILEDSFFSNNGAGGVALGGFAVVTGNTVTGSTGSNGMFVSVCSVVIGNTARGNGNGMVVENGSTIMNNTVRNNVTGLSVSCCQTSFCSSNLTNVLENTLRGNSTTDLVNVAPQCRLLDNSIGTTSPAACSP